MDMKTNGPLTDVRTLRENARRHVADGAVTVGYAADRDAVLLLLNDALATEIVCVLRYRRHHFMARGIHSQSVAAEFLQQGGGDPTTRRLFEGILAVEEEHADELADLLQGFPVDAPDVRRSAGNGPASSTKKRKDVK